jgi:hypothetical protein
VAFPEYNELEEPLLVFIFLNGGEQYQVPSNETYDPLANYFGLHEDDRIKTRDEVFGDGKNEKAWSNRVQWARKSLNDYGYLDKNAPRGIWRLSEKGKNAAGQLTSRYPFFNPHPDETDSAVDIETPERIEATVYRILRDTPLARNLKDLHQNKCQICGKVIKLSDAKNYFEAHHIKPLGGTHKGPDTKENIIVLCPDHHVQCDYGAMRLDLEQIRSIPGHRISASFVDYHNEHIYNKMA